MLLYVIGLLLIYMILNVFTDLKYRKTKNMWHLLLCNYNKVVDYTRKLFILQQSYT